MSSLLPDKRSGCLNIAQTKPTDHRLPVLEQVRGVLEDAESASLLTARTQRDAGRLCLEKHGGTFSAQAALTHRSYLRCFPPAADKHTRQPASTESIRTPITSFLVGTKACLRHCTAPWPKGKNGKYRRSVVCVLLQHCSGVWRDGEEVSMIATSWKNPTKIPQQKTRSVNNMHPHWHISFQRAANCEWHMCTCTHALSHTTSPPARAFYTVPHTCTQHIIQLSVKRTLDS